MNKLILNNIIENALIEDIGYKDITSDNIFDSISETKAVLLAKDTGVLSGLNVFAEVFNIIDKNIKIDFLKQDSDKCEYGEKICEIKGVIKNILKGERVSLNFLQHMSGISTQTAKYVKIAEKYGVKIVDTRKTLPGLRMLQKYAVKCGGGHNHRIGLYDMVMIKDNHIKSAGSISEAVKLIRSKVSFPAKIEVETFNLNDVKEALDNKVDIIMLDNFELDKMKQAVNLVNKQSLIEISGNVNLENLEDICLAKPDIVSVGNLTHSVKAFDISLKIG
jgi:nicotinate-nucleotide pyrophosphorylase (carboxylating)